MPVKNVCINLYHNICIVLNYPNVSHPMFVVSFLVNNIRTQELVLLINHQCTHQLYSLLFEEHQYSGLNQYSTNQASPLDKAVYPMIHLHIHNNIHSFSIYVPGSHHINIHVIIDSCLQNKLWTIIILNKKYVIRHTEQP